MVRDPLAVIALEAPDGERGAPPSRGHVARPTLVRRRHFPLVPVGHPTVGALPAAHLHQPLQRVGCKRLAQRTQQGPLPLTTQPRRGHIRPRLPALPRLIIPATGGAQMPGGGYGPFRPGVWSTVRAPPWSALPLTSPEPSSRHCTPQRLHARHTTGAVWETMGRNIAGTVRRMGRYLTPSCRPWLPWLTQVATETWAQRKHNDD
jgi:hypothetical protein